MRYGKDRPKKASYNYSYRRRGGAEEGFLRTFLKGISFGKVYTGLYYREKHSYSTVCTGVLSILLLVWLVMMDVNAFTYTFSKQFYYTSVDQGPYAFSKDLKGSSTIQSYITTLNPRVQVASGDSNFCESHKINGFF